MHHHSAEVTALESVRIKMVTQLAMDGMHMFDLGLGKFIASALFNREVRDGIDVASLCAEYAMLESGPANSLALLDHLVRVHPGRPPSADNSYFTVLLFCYTINWTPDP